MKLPNWVYWNIERLTNTLIPRQVVEEHRLCDIKRHLEKKYDVPFKVWEVDGRVFAERLKPLKERKKI